MAKPRLARPGEAAAIMAFIRDNWSAKHVLARDQSLFDWQHRDEAQQRYNFILSGEGDDLSGILGFIPASRYDPALRDEDTLWLTTWKVREKRAAGLGAVLLMSLDRMLPHGWIGTVGLNLATRGIYDALGYETGQLTRYFLLGPEPHRLAVVPDGFRQPQGAGGASIVQLDKHALAGLSEEALPHSAENMPRKTPRLFVARYLEHPYYAYSAWQVTAGDASCVLITRVCRHDGAVALRVVDFLGAPAALSGARNAFETLLRVHGAEYLDFYCSGLALELEKAGLCDVASVDGLVLPAYFEPYEAKNVDLYYSLKGRSGRTIICKGDADQDRPNLLAG